MSLLAKVVLGAAKAAIAYAVVDTAEGDNSKINQKLNEVKDSMKKTYDEKIYKMADGRNIFTLSKTPFPESGEAYVKDETGANLYYVTKLLGGKAYYLLDSNRNEIAYIYGDSSAAKIKYNNNIFCAVEQNLSLKGSYYTIAWKRTWEEKGLFNRTKVRIERLNDEGDHWRVNADLMGGKHFFYLDSKKIAETKTSLSLMDDTQTYLFLDSTKGLENVLLFTLAIDVIGTHKSESISQTSEYDYKKEMKKMQKEYKKNQKENKKERKIDWDKLAGKDYYYELDDEQDDLED